MIDFASAKNRIRLTVPPAEGLFYLNHSIKISNCRARMVKQSESFLRIDKGRKATKAGRKARLKTWKPTFQLAPPYKTNSSWLGRSLALHSVLLIGSQSRRYNSFVAKRSRLIFVKFLYYVLPETLFLDHLKAELHAKRG